MERDASFIYATGNDRPSLKDLYNHVVPDAAQKWKDLGVQLLRPDQENILNIIEMDNNDSTSRCKCVLEKWLETATDATWDCLIEALESPNIRLDYMANQLKQRMIIQMTEVEKCKENLKHCYCKRINQKKSTKWPRLGDPTFYVDITIVRATFLPGRLRQEHGMSFDKRIHSFTTVDELLKDGYGKVILIEGDPGAGKSTFVFQLCKKWGEDELPSLMEDVVFWIPLRHYQSVASVNELFHKLGYPKMVNFAEKNNGKGLVLIFDGWDELPKQLQTSSLFHDIIFSTIKTFDHSTIIVTSRPSCSATIAEAVEETNSYYKIMGFDRYGIIKYMEAYFNLSNELAAFIDLIDENFCQQFNTPISLAVMCFVMHSNEQIPKTITKSIEHCIVLHLRSHIPDSCSQGLNTLHDLPENIRAPFIKFCKLAFDMLKDDKLILCEGELKFMQDDLDALQLEKFDGFGLLHIDNYINAVATMEKSYSFIHRGVQEALAAIFILNNDGIIDETFEKYFHEDSHLLNVFTFIFGLAPKNVHKLLIRKLIEKSDPCIKFFSSILRCLIEADDITLCREFGQLFSKEKNIFLWTSSVLDCFYACSFISACGIKRLNVTMYCDHLPSPDLHFMVIARLLQKSSVDIASFRFVKFGQIMSCTGMELLAKTLSAQHNIFSVELIIESPIVFDTSMDCVTILCNSICKHNRQITNLVLPYTIFSERDLDSIGSVLSNCLSLRSLEMIFLYNEQSCLGLLSVFFCKALCETKSLKKLSIGLSKIDSAKFGNIVSQNCSLKDLCVLVDSADCLGPFLNGLSSNTSIARFVAKFDKICLPFTSEQHLENFVTSNHSITAVDLAGASWSATHVNSVCVGLCVNTTLATLDISGCFIDPEACRAICGMLSQNKALHHLFLNPIHLEKQEAIALIDSCRSNATLEVLSLVKWSLSRKEPFRFSNHPEIINIMQKIQTIRLEKSESFLTFCWNDDCYQHIKEQIIPTIKPWLNVTF